MLKFEPFLLWPIEFRFDKFWIWIYGVRNSTFCADLSEHISVIDFRDC